MASTTVRVSAETHELLRKLAAPRASRCSGSSSGRSRTTVASSSSPFLDAAYERLQADPVAWKDYLAEQAELEGTLADGLDDL